MNGLRLGATSEPEKWALELSPWDDPRLGPQLEVKITEWGEDREAVYLDRAAVESLRDWMTSWLGDGEQELPVRCDPSCRCDGRLNGNECRGVINNESQGCPACRR